ncbi:MAG: hypothetical protein RL497_2122 [Pseudomonadota bacterium]
MQTPKHPACRAIFFALCAGFSLSACQNYPLTLNGNSLNPAPLFSAFHVEDKHLAACIKEHIFDAKAAKVEDIKHLNCPHRAIRSLKGLETFSHLLRIKLTENPIQSITPLLAIPSLEEVNLEGSASHCAEVNVLRARGVKVGGGCKA